MAITLTDLVGRLEETLDEIEQSNYGNAAQRLANTIRILQDGLYLCSGSLVFTANSGSGTQLQVEWTQAETNTVGTCALTPAITGVFPVNGTPVSVYAKAGTIIYIKSLILGGTATYSASGTIQLIKAY